jgi:Family of unknown function (DUF6510)
MDDQLVLDGNAAGGPLAAAYGADVTARQGRCIHCGTVSVVANLRAYVEGPGTVLRCPACGRFVIRIVETPAGLRIDDDGLEGLPADR